MSNRIEIHYGIDILKQKALLNGKNIQNFHYSELRFDRLCAKCPCEIDREIVSSHVRKEEDSLEMILKGMEWIKN